MICLDRDLLFEIAGNLLLIQKNRKDNFTDIKCQISNVANFMLVDRKCKAAFLSQFSLSKSFCFNEWEDSELSNSGRENKTVFRKVFDKEKWFMALLIQNKKFNPEELILSHVLKAKLEDKQRIADLNVKSAIEYLSVLCNLDDGGLNLANYRGPELRLKIFEAVADFNLLVYLDNFLGLSATVTRLNMSFDNFHCLPETANFSSIDSPRIESLELTFNSKWDDLNDEIFPESEWMEMLLHAVNSCPNLKNLCLTVNLHESHPSGSNVYDRLYKAIQAMIKKILPKVMKEQCFLQVKFNAFVFSFDLPEVQSSGHELFRLGFHKVTENSGEVCRMVAIDGCCELSFCISDFYAGGSYCREGLEHDVFGFYTDDYYSDHFSGEYCYDY